MTKKPDRGESRNSVERVLLEVWDPLGVRDLDGAQDEYRTYAKRIVEMLRHGRDAYAIEEYLRRAESGWLGFSNEERIKRAVLLVLKHKAEVD